MRIIVTNNSNGTINVCYAKFYNKRVYSHTEIESNRFNIFGHRLNDIRREVYKDETYLIEGDGIKTFTNKNEFNSFLIGLFLENLKYIKIYKNSQIHTKVL